MTIYLNADDIFRVGVQIEINGKLFYETAEKQARETGTKELFRELAAWENQHIELFERLRLQLPETAREENLFDPGSELETNIKATADSHIFIRNKDISSLVSTMKTPQEVLDLAITFEKDSVVFYSTMKKAIPESFGKERMDTLIDEEIRHIAMLTQQKEKLGRQG
jgi:rubrerythrin